MKKGFLIALAAVVLLAASCVKQAEETVVPVSGFPKITATTNGGPATKVSVGEAVDGVRALTWDKGDALSVFYRSSIPMKYVLEGEGGEASGVFGYAAGAGGGPEFPLVYAAYPYDRDVKYEDGALLVTVPPVQKYTAGGFDPKANVMVGAADPGANLYFKNVGGYLVFQFWGEDAEVSKVTVSGAMAEYLAGQVLMGVEDGYTPWIEEWDEGSEEVSLVCNPPVKVGATADAATEFWLVVMPQTLMDGFTVTVEWNGGTFSQTMDASYEVVRSKVNRLSPLELNSFSPDDPIAFKDADLKAHLVECGVDTNDDGEISYAEAAAVTSFEGFFDGNVDEEGYPLGYPFTSFDEFQYFTGITSIRGGQFQNWDKMTSIQFPPSLTLIPGGALSGCAAVTSITVPGTVKQVTSGAFQSCTGLVTLIFEEGVETIGNCLNGCTSLEKIVIPGTVSSITSGLCYQLPNLKEVTLGYGIQEINGGAFSNCPSLLSLEIPGSVTDVYSGAFSYDTALKTVIFGEGVKNISNCLGGCASLEKVVFPGTVESIVSGLCSGLSNLKEVTLGNGIKNIGTGAFYQCSSLEAIAIPGSVETVDSGSFSDCTSMKTLTFGEGVKLINSSAFSGCSSLTEVDIPGSVETVGYTAFYNCSALKDVTMHAGTKTIWNAAFSGTAIESFTFPGTVKQVVASVFGGCTKLQSVDLAGVEILDSGSFTGLASLTSVTMHEGLKTIYQAFSDSGLTSVEIPASVTYLGGGAFADCPLTSATFLGTTPPDGNSGAFSGTTCPIYVPASAVETYKTSTVWGSLADRIVAAP